MFIITPKRLSSLVGFFLLISMILFSLGLFVWTYRHAAHSISQELQNAFEQRHSIAEIVMEYQLEFIERILQEIAKHEPFSLAMAQNHQGEAETMVYDILDSSSKNQLEIVFITGSEDSVWLDVSSPFFDIEPILPEIIEQGNAIVSAGQILRIKKDAVDLTMMLRAVPIIHQLTGKKLGTLFGGLVLNNNLTLLERIQKKTQTDVTAFLESGDIIASTETSDAPGTRTLLEARQAASKEGEIHAANGFLSSYRTLFLQEQPTSLEIAAVIPDHTLIVLQRSYQRQGIILLLFSFVFLSVTVLTFRWLTVPPLKRLVTYSQDISSGNLQTEYAPGIITEFNQLGQALIEMVAHLFQEITERKRAEKALEQRVFERTTQVEALQNLIEQVMNGSEHLEQTSEGMTQISTRMASGADQASQQIQIVSSNSQQISRGVQSVSTAIEEVAANIREISCNIHEVSDSIIKTVDIVNSANTTIASLKTHSQEIGEIIQVIAGITGQTNLLALNAAIEAARAGDAGKGFKVVADEVKELARETALSAEDVTRKIGAIQSSSQNAIEAIAQVAEIIKRVSELANAIAVAILEQSHTTDDISRTMIDAAAGSEEISRAIIEVATTVRDSSEQAVNVLNGARELSSLAEQLHKLVEAFKI